MSGGLRQHEVDPKMGVCERHTSKHKKRKDCKMWRVFHGCEMCDGDDYCTCYPSRAPEEGSR